MSAFRNGDASTVIRSGRSHIPGPVAPRNRVKHGATVGKPNKEYRAWCGMHTRCTNKNSAYFHRYGARGISVCDRWQEFRPFMDDLGPAPSPAHSIDRFPDMNGNYEPGNVRWATASEQQCNRTTTKLTMDMARDVRSTIGSGESLDAIADRFGISRTMVRKIRLGVSWREST